MLFKTIEDIQKYGQVYKSLWNGTNNLIATEINDAEAEFLIKAISKTQYDQLHAAYHAAPGTAMPIPLAAILELAQSAVAEIATALYVSKKGLIVIGANGATQPGNSENRASSQWAVRSTATEYIRSGNRAIDRLLEFMEANKGDYALWVNSTAYTVYKEIFVTSASELTSFIPLVKNSRTVYKSLVPFIKTAEDVIRSTVGTPLFAELKSQHLATTTTNENKALLEYIRNATSYLAYSYGLKHMAISIDEYGATTYDSTAGRDTVDTKQQAELNTIAVLEENARVEGLRVVAKLKEYLIENAATYPLFAVPTESGQLKNLITDKVFRL